MNKEQGMMNAELKLSTFADRHSLFDIQKGAPRPYGNLGPRFFNLELVWVYCPDPDSYRITGMENSGLLLLLLFVAYDDCCGPT